jgi:serine O-acetyltransferase
MGARMTPFEADVRRYQSDFPRGRPSLARLLARRTSLQVLAVYRFGRWSRQRPDRAPRSWLRPVLWLLYPPLRGVIGRAYGIDLSPTADIGPGFYIGHGGGIEVRHCTIGAHCSIAQQTKIGPLAPGGEGPTIGSRVWIGAHAQVRGPITIGDGATIAAGAHVFRDVPDRALVAGNPARVVRWRYDNAAILGEGLDRTTRAAPADTDPVREPS